MKLSKLLLQAMVVAIAAGTISSCKKENLEKIKKTVTGKPKPTNTPEPCPACGMG